MSAGFESVYASHPMGIGAVRWSAQRVTLIAKLTFVVSEAGDLVLAPWEAQEGPGIDRFDDGGELLWPSDFAPHKPGCDVVVVGADVGLRSAPARLAVGPFALTASAGDRLGARESFASDPTAQEAFALWTAGAIPPSRFHAAPPHLRAPWLSCPFYVFYERGGASLGGRFTGPWPTFSVLDRTGRRLAYLTPPVDLVGIEASTGRVTMVGRVVYDAVAAPLDVSTLVMDLPPHPSVAPSDHWHAPRVVSPADAARAAETSPSSVGMRFEGTVAASRGPGSPEDHGARAALPVLPFEAGHAAAPAVRGVVGPADFAALRRPAASPAWDGGEGTVVALAPSMKPSHSPPLAPPPSAVPSPAAATVFLPFTARPTSSAIPAFAPLSPSAAAPTIAAAPTSSVGTDWTVVGRPALGDPGLPFHDARASRDARDAGEQRPSPVIGVGSASEPAGKTAASGWTDDGSETRAAVIMPARGLPFRAGAGRDARARPEAAPSLGAAELRARMRALDEPDQVPTVPARAALAVELERWAARLEDGSPTGALAALLKPGHDA